MTRRTPVEAVAHILPESHILRDPIKSREKAKLGSPPEKLLKQLDSRWTPLEIPYPVFPSIYPPEFPPLLDATAIETVYTTGENAAFEWLGDAIIRVALNLCVFRSTRASRATIDQGIVGNLVATTFLAHVALLYGIQLHDYMPASEIPGMERICDIFESFVGALAIHSGFSKVLEPLCLLFAPWAEKLCEADSSSSSPEVGRRVRDKYQFALRRLAGVSPAPLKPLNLQPLESNSSAWCIPRLADPSELLTAHMRGWRTLDSSGVELPPNYPPPVPAVESSHLRLWTEALTDVHCRLYFGTEVGSNHRYRAVGESLYALAVTTLAIDHAPAHSPAQLNELRIECTNKDLVARLGLILNLHANLRVLRIVDEADWVAPNRVATAFYAVVAVVYLQTDWSTLMAWLGELLSPWVDAAAQRRLRASSGAEKQWSERLQATSEDPTGVRACYLTTVPKSRRNHKTRSRVAGRMGMHAA